MSLAEAITGHEEPHGDEPHMPEAHTGIVEPLPIESMGSAGHGTEDIRGKEVHAIRDQNRLMGGFVFTPTQMWLTVTPEGHVLAHDRGYVDVRGEELAVLRTQPVDPRDRNGEIIANLPGYLESVGLAAQGASQEGIARLNPRSAVIGIENNGVGSSRITGIGHWQSYGLERMATQRLDLLNGMTKDNARTCIIACSMGSVIATILLDKNSQRDNPAEIDGAVFNATAIMESKHATALRLAKFGRQMALCTARTVLSGDTGILGAALSPRQKAAQLRELFDLLLIGTPYARISRVAGDYALAVNSGAEDPIFIEPMWRSLAQQNPDRLLLNVIPHFNHNLVLRPDVVVPATQRGLQHVRSRQAITS